MRIAVTWQPDTPGLETVYIEDAGPLALTNLQELIAGRDGSPDAVMRLEVSTTPGGPTRDHTFRLGRLRSAVEHTPDAADTDPCCGETVGVLIFDGRDRMLMFERVKPPKGVAPVAGHVGEHGTARAAAVAEVGEEVGLQVTSLTQRAAGWQSTWCRRGGTGHFWRVFEATVGGDVHVKPDEAANARWLSRREVERLAGLTVAHARGAAVVEVGLEPVWVLWLAAMETIEVSPADLGVVAEYARRPPAV